MSNHVKGIDGIKGIGAVGIMIYHYGHFRPSTYAMNNILFPIYAYGHFLVELFFLISGYLFFSTYKGKIETERITFSAFILSRLKKLWPLFTLTTMVCLLEQCILLLYTGKYYSHPVNIYSLFLNLIGLQHVGLDNELSFNGPAWYISVLLLCYTLYFNICRIQSRIFKGGVTTQVTFWTCFTGMIIGLAIYRFALSISITLPYFNDRVARGLISFSVGGIACCALQNIESKIIKRSSLVTLSVVFILWYLFRNTSIDIFGDRLLCFALIVWPAVFFLIIKSPPLTILFSLPPFLWLGKISYSIYLWHFPVILFLVLCNSTTINTFDYSSIAFWLLYVSLSIIVATLSHYLIEPHLHRSMKRFDANAKS